MIKKKAIIPSNFFFFHDYELKIQNQSYFPFNFILAQK